MSNAERFMGTFGKLERAMRQLHPDHADSASMGFKEVVRNVSARHSFVRRRLSDIFSLSDLRNAIAHRDDSNRFMAEPHDEAVALLDEIFETLTKPPNAYEIASKPTYKCSTSDVIADVLKTMKEHLYTHVPVYEEERFKGVLTESSIANWVADHLHEGGLVVNTGTIKDIEQYLGRLNETDNLSMFIPRDADIHSIAEAFESNIRRGTRLGALFVAHSGSVREHILGVITSWDLPKIYDRQSGNR